MYSEVFTTCIEARCATSGVRDTYRAYLRLPSAVLEDFLDALPERCRSHLAILSQDPQGGFFYHFYGPAIVAVTGFDMTGKRTADFASEVGRFFGTTYTRSFTERVPIFALHRASHALNVHVWERLILPMSRRDGLPVAVAVIIPREFKTEFLQAVLASSPDAIFAIRSVRDEGGHITDALVVAANNRFADMIGRPVAQVEGGRLLDLIPGLVRRGLWDRCVQTITSRQPDQFEAEFAAAGAGAWLRVSAVPLGDGLSVCLSDITNLKAAVAAANAALQEAEAAREAVLQQSRTDYLTGVLTRREFDVRMRSLHLEHLSHGGPLVVVALDIDHFKSVNDRYGHFVGDQVLIGVANAVTAEVRPGLDVIGRIGGEEFMIAMPGSTAADAVAAAERIRLRLGRTTFRHGAGTFQVTASFGVKQVGVAEALHDLLVGADAALYRAKGAGRNLVISAAA